MPERAWSPANCGAGKMRWFLVKEGPKPDYRYDAAGRLIRYSSHAAALRAAARLNAHQEVAP